MKKITNVLLAGAIGDAFGYLVEFDDTKTIHQKHGPQGLKFDKFYDGIICSDDTQMTLFLLDAIKNTNEPYNEEMFKELSHGAFYDWYKTQVGFDKAPDDYTKLNKNSFKPSGKESMSLSSIRAAKRQPVINDNLSRDDFKLLYYSPMWKQCAPGMTCLRALGTGQIGEVKEYSTPINDSMGCGMVMRVAPVLALLEKYPYLSDLDILNAAYIQAGVTHGNTEGLYVTGIYLLTLKYLLEGQDKITAFKNAIDFVYHPANDTFNLIKRVPFSLRDYLNKIVNLVESPGILNANEIAEVCGEGWIATSCVGLAFYAFCKAISFEHCLELAVNHQGDSDSTGTLAGQLYAAHYNVDFSNYKKTDLTEVIIAIAEK